MCSDLTQPLTGVMEGSGPGQRQAAVPAEGYFSGSRVLETCTPGPRAAVGRLHLRAGGCGLGDRPCQMGRAQERDFNPRD